MAAVPHIDNFADLTRVDDHPDVRVLLDRRTAAEQRIREIEAELAAAPADRRYALAHAVEAFIETGETGEGVPVLEVDHKRLQAEHRTMSVAMDEIGERIRETRVRVTDELLAQYRVADRAEASRTEVAQAVDVLITVLLAACDARHRIYCAGLAVGETVEPGGDIGVLKALAAFRLRLGDCNEAQLVALQNMVRR